VPDGRVDHLWIRVRDPAASKRFYTTIAPHAGRRVGADEPDHLQMIGEGFRFSLIHDGRPLTEHVHLAFSARSDATVRRFTPPRSMRALRTTAVPASAPDGHNVEVVNHNR